MKKNIDIIMLGDSITGRANWKELLEEEHLVNLGIDGDTTFGILSRINRVVELDPKFVFLMAGINDLLVSVPIDDVLANYKNILEVMKENDINTIVQSTLITRMETVNKKIKSFNELLEEYCKKEGIKFLDLNYAFSDDNDLLREGLTIDGLHLGQSAYKVWAYKLKQMENYGF